MESVQTGTAKHGRTVVLTEVRETGIRLKRGGVLQRRVDHHGVWRVTPTWVMILNRSIKIRVRIRECHLCGVPSWVVPVWQCGFFHLLMLLLSSREIGDALSPPGGSMASLRQIRWRAGALQGIGRPRQVSWERFRGDGSL